MPAVRAAKLDGVNWHTLRHTFCTRPILAGVDVRTCQELMGHKSLALTERYAHVSKRIATKRATASSEAETDPVTP